MGIPSEPFVIRLSIRPSTGKHGEPSLATHRAQPHPRQLRYQYRKSCGSRRPVIHWTISTVPQNITLFHPSICTSTLYSIRYFFYFSRASPRGLCGTRVFEQRVRWTRQGTSTEASAAQPPCARLRNWSRQTSRRYPLDTALPLWQYPSVLN